MCFDVLWSPKRDGFSPHFVVYATDVYSPIPFQLNSFTSDFGELCFRGNSEFLMLRDELLEYCAAWLAGRPRGRNSAELRMTSLRSIIYYLKIISYYLIMVYNLYKKATALVLTQPWTQMPNN